jgi:hypothetical protein
MGLASAPAVPVSPSVRRGAAWARPGGHAQPFRKLVVVVLRARDAAVADHRLGQFHGRLGVDVLTVDGVAMGEAAARPILDAPAPTGRRPHAEAHHGSIVPHRV